MKIVWNYSALFSSSIRTLSLSTKQGLLILKKARNAQPQKSKKWMKGYNKESNKTFNKTFNKPFYKYFHLFYHKL